MSIRICIFSEIPFFFFLRVFVNLLAGIQVICEPYVLDGALALKKNITIQSDEGGPLELINGKITFAKIWD